MHIRDLIVERLGVATVKVDQSVSETLAKINETGYRCIPVVDNEDAYKGMIYKVDLLSYLYEDKGELIKVVTENTRVMRYYQPPEIVYKPIQIDTAR